jgi:septal ring factor EnvC (AmiA/AmiB activator)
MFPSQLLSPQAVDPHFTTWLVGATSIITALSTAGIIKLIDRRLSALDQRRQQGWRRQDEQDHLAISLLRQQIDQLQVAYKSLRDNYDQLMVAHSNCQRDLAVVMERCRILEKRVAELEGRQDYESGSKSVVA